MKNKLLFGMFLFAGLGVATAQNALVNLNKGVNTNVAKENANYSPKALGQDVWVDNFDSIVSGPGLTTVSASSWTTANTGTATPGGSEFGWTIDNVYDGWWMTSGFLSTSGGNFAELSNGDPTQGTGTQAVGPVYTMTSGVIDVATLAGGPGVILSFEQTGAKFYDNASVLISVDGTNWTEVYTNVNKPMHAQGASNPWDNPELIEVDIESVISASPSTVQVRFQWTSEFTTGPNATNPNAWIAYGWLVDDVKITTKPDFDLANYYNDHHVVGYQYTQVPSTQVSPITFLAGVKNQGTQPLTDVTLTVTDGTVVGTSTPQTFAPNTLDTIEASYALPNAVGTYTVNQSLSMVEADDNSTNNTNLPVVSVDVTDHTYAIDNGASFSEFPAYDLSVGGNPVNVDGVGTSFDIYANQDLYGIDFRLYTGTQMNAQLYGQLFEFDPNAADNASLWIGPLQETDLFTVTTSSQINSMQTLTFNSPASVEAGKTYLVLLRSAGTDTARFAASGSTSDQAWIHIIDTDPWGTFTDAPVIRMNFDASLGVNTTEAIQEVAVYPNPATDEAVVEYNLTSASDVTIKLIDINGKVVETVSLNNTSVGQGSTTLNVADLAAGVYNVSITSNDSSIVKKLIIK